MELLEAIEKLSALPSGVHWFCPRASKDDHGLYLPQDRQANTAPNNVGPQELDPLLANAKSRKEMALLCLQIFSYDGDKAKPFQDKIETGLSNQLASCDICIREYHRARSQIKTDLERYHDTDEVDGFMQRLDDVNRRRISNGLSLCKQSLEAVDPTKRSLKTVAGPALFAIFETLNCEPLLADEQFLQDHFDHVLKLIQTSRSLKVSTHNPGMAYFLFQDNAARKDWASRSWKRLGNISGLDFDNSVQRPLEVAMERVLLSCLDKAFLPTFWEGVHAICDNLDANLIARHLRTMKYDVCKLALDHLQVDGQSFRHLLASMDRILRVAPEQFWEALSASSPGIWCDQYKDSPALFNALQNSFENRDEKLWSDVFRWTGPFLSTMKPSTQALASRPLLQILFVDLQRDTYSRTMRARLFSEGVTMISTSLSRLVTDKISPSMRVAITESLDIVTLHAEKLLTKAAEMDSQLVPGINSVIRDALNLECMSLLCDHDLMADGRSFQHEGCNFHEDLWQSALQSVNRFNSDLACKITIGASALVGLENFVIKPNEPRAADLRKFNTAFAKMNTFIAQVLQTVSTWDSSVSEPYFKDANKADALFGQACSSDEDVRTESIEVMKAATGTNVRRDALHSLMEAKSFVNVVHAQSTTLRRVAYMRSYTPVSWLMTLTKDFMSILCDSSDGLLRRGLSDTASIKAAENFWDAIWLLLQSVFMSTESWSLQGHDKNTMIKFCGEIMEFAGQIFDKSPLFASAIDNHGGSSGDMVSGAGKRLTVAPRETFPTMLKFLRLRDEFLLSKSVALVCDVLKRLKRFSSRVEDAALTQLGDFITGEARTALTETHKAELLRALEIHGGSADLLAKLAKDRQAKDASSKKTLRTGTIDLDKWQANAHSDTRPTTLQSTIKSATPAFNAFQARQQAAAAERAKNLKPSVDTAEIGRKRQEEAAAKKRRDAEAAAKARRAYNRDGVDAFTAGQGSGISKMGVSGKDHSIPKGEGMMVSSDESDSDDSGNELDRAIFRGKKKPQVSEEVRMLDEDRQRRAALAKKQQQGPVKKTKVVRSQKDMRARLKPDLTSLHSQLLSWNYTHQGPFPPNSSKDDYATVLSTFRDPAEYKRTFEALLKLEAWNSFLKAKEESTAKSVEVKIGTITDVDQMAEVIVYGDANSGQSLMEGDFLLLSKSAMTVTSVPELNCLARVQNTKRQKGRVEFMLLISPKTPMSKQIRSNGMIHALKIMSLVPLEREYGALVGLPYYDLCEEILKAKPSPLLNYLPERLKPYEDTYEVNQAQAKAIRSALDNDAFTLIQGPPGSGKTKTIIALSGALLTAFLQSQQSATINGNGPLVRKLLVCAPSNAAVDELVLRLKGGLRSTTGRNHRINVVRLGRPDAIIEKNRDVALDNLVDQRLKKNAESGPKESTSAGELMQQHKATSENLHKAREAYNTSKSEDDRKAIAVLSEQRKQLSQQIDRAKDNETRERNLRDRHRRETAQLIVNEAHVICATLSGSGHDMFQTLNIEFDTVIIDEAAQCVELSALIPLKYGCSKCILVGDPQQLPPTVLSREAAKFKYEQSLFFRMQANHANNVHLLDTQYRMHPTISAFPSKAFYDGRLKDGKGMEPLRRRPWHGTGLLGPYQFFDIEGQHRPGRGGHSLINVAEIQAAILLYQRLIKDWKDIDFKGKIGIITPYKSQLMELRQRFQNEFDATILSHIEFNTTDAFQGRECEIIIFSCVRASASGGIGFVNDIRRMNVGLTRAKTSLWVLGNSSSLSRGEFWSKLIQHSKDTGCYVSGDISSRLSRPLPLVKQIEASTESWTPPSAPTPNPRKPSNSTPNTAGTSTSSSRRPSEQSLSGAPFRSGAPPLSIDPALAIRSSNSASSSPYSAGGRVSAASAASPHVGGLSASSSRGSRSPAGQAVESDNGATGASTPASATASVSVEPQQQGQADDDDEEEGEEDALPKQPARAPPPVIVRRKRKGNIFASDPTKRKRVS